MATQTQPDGKSTTAADTSAEQSVRLPPRIRSILGRMRRRIRAYVWLEGIAVSVVWLGIAFWIYLLFDWLIEPAWPVRMVVIGGVAIVLATILFRLILRRTFVPLTNANMAVLLERNFRELDDRLLTAVELTGHSDHAQEFSPEMLRHTTDQALGLSGQMRLGRAFNMRPLLLRIAAAVMLAGTIGAFVTLAPNVFGFYWERLTGSPEPWPRDTLLQVEGFATRFAVVVEGRDSVGPLQSDQIHVYHGAVQVDRNEPSRMTQIVSAGYSISTASGDGRKFSPLVSQSALQVTPGLDKLGRISAADDARGLVALRRISGGSLKSNGAEIRTGQWLPKTECRLAQGTAELMFSNGVVVVVQGPAEFRIRSSTRMSLLTGRLSVIASTRASDFMVDTPTATVRTLRNDTLKVVRGSDVAIFARAYALKTIPKMVELRYKTAGGGNGRDFMQQKSTAIPGRDEFQYYSYTFKNVLSSIQFSISGGDDRIDDLKIQVVDSPRFIESMVYCQFPDYLVDAASGRFTPRKQPAVGAVQLPQGTNVTVHVQANTSIKTVHVRRSDQPDPVVVSLPADREDRSRFQYEFGKLNTHTTLLFTLFDEDGISNREPIPLLLTAIADEPPSVEVKLRGVGTAITPNARMTIGGQISDDHGLARVWHSLAVGQQEPTEHVLRESFGGQRKVTFGEPPVGNMALDLKQVRLLFGLSLSPGDQIGLSIKATDGCTLGQSPNVGQGDTYYLEVVTPEELLSRLESRELILRQKFETTIAELEQTRDRLADPAFAPFVQAADEKSDGDEKLSPRPGSGNASSLVERASQNSERSAYETNGIALAFLEIRDELITNRIDTPQRKQRLEQQIAQPLQRIVDEMFPALAEQIETLQTRVALESQLSGDRDILMAKGDDARRSKKSLTEKIEQAEAKLAALRPAATLAAGCREQADVILSEMNVVLGKMLELEDYNRLVEILRELIKRQEDLNKKTKKKQLQDLGLG